MQTPPKLHPQNDEDDDEDAKSILSMFNKDYIRCGEIKFTLRRSSCFPSGGKPYAFKSKHNFQQHFQRVHARN